MYTYEDIIPSYIPNTTLQKGYSNGVANSYWIRPCEGYVLHDKNLDQDVFDPVTWEPTGEVLLGFTPLLSTTMIDYDWETNPREFYAVLRTEVPENQIFGGGQAPEIM